MITVAWGTTRAAAIRGLHGGHYGTIFEPSVSFACVCDHGAPDLGCQADVDTEAARRTDGPGITTAMPSTDSDALASNG